MATTSVLDQLRTAGVADVETAPARAMTFDVDHRLRTSMVGLPITAFGEVATAEKSPQLQVSFDTNVDALEWDMTTAGTLAAAQGLVTFTDGTAMVTTNGKDGGGATMSTTEYAHYHPGQGLVIQLAAEFAEGGVAGNETIIGYGDASNGLFYGYNGAAFGLLMRSTATGSVVNTWVAQTDWNVDTLDGEGPSGMTLDPTKANVFIVRAQFHYMGRIAFYVVSPDHDFPQLVHLIKHNNTGTGMTLRTASLPLHLSTQNDAGITAQVSVKTSSMAVFIEGRMSHGSRKFSYGTSRTDITSEEHLLTLRLRDTVLGATNHGHILLTNVGTGTTGNRPGFIRMYKNAKVFGTTLTYAQHHLCSIVEQSEQDTTIGGVLSGAVDDAVGEPVYQVNIAGVDGSSDRLAGCMVHMGGFTRRILTSTGSSPTTITVAAMDLTPAAANALTATIYNGAEVFTQALGKDASMLSAFSSDQLIHLSPGESITFTAESSAAAEIWLAVSWIEKIG